ncbi:MAG: amino-acid N-acetyltransferase [Verrucomicrobia bacterium]|nr:MAG: amino-acid N-acetyltransferase [Verrucomicrobiota bacterium]
MKPTDLRGILQYIPLFRGKTFVIALDGAVVADDNFGNLLKDLAVLRSLGINIVVVHGAGAQIEELARQRGVTPSDLDGSGVTDAATLELALAAAHTVTHRIMEGLAALDLRAVTPNAIVAHPLGILRGVDHQHTGKIERVDAPLLQTLLERGIAPVLPPFGFDGEGRTFRVNSDAVAVAVARAVAATKILFVTPYEGLMHRNQMLRQVLVTDLERILREEPESIPAAARSKARHAVEACLTGVARVHLIDGRADEALLSEIFSNEGVGTLVYASEYREIRPARRRDISEILKLIRPAIAKEELVPRTRAQIERQLGDFYLYEIDGNPVACVALHVDEPSATAEIACLCVKPAHENQGIGRRLLRFLEETARHRGVRRLLALSTQAFAWFEQKGGFREGAEDDLPPARRESYRQSRRRSRIMVKELK